MKLLERLEFDAADLVTKHPPRFLHPHKRLLYALACPPNRPHAGRIHYSRWQAEGLPATLGCPSPSNLVEHRQDLYDYSTATAQPKAMEWHVNFADPELFVAYGSELFAQDEMQVMEHPALGALREGLDARRSVALTVERGHPTPVLVAGVERRVRIATDPDTAEGRPRGLYGNMFAWASPEAIRRASTPIIPPTISNVIAMAAPRPGVGSYRSGEIMEALTAAYTGFCAACLEAQRLGGTGTAAIVHTGFWGCGAFGGNRVLMPFLQIFAAGLAGLNRLVFHTHNPAGTRSLSHALSLAEDLHATLPSPTLADLISNLLLRDFQWGVSDGN